MALFVGPQYSEQNQLMANNEKAFMWYVTVMNLALIWSYFVRTFSVGLKIFCSGWGGRGAGGEKSEHVTHVVYETLKQCKLL